MENYKVAPERKAHLYALMAWSDKYTKEEAMELAFTAPYDSLNGITWAEDSILTGLSGVVHAIDSNELQIPAENTPEEWDAVVKILADIHDKWVKSNAKKYDRGNEIKSNKNLFQHLPTALIGIDELAKDLMFLAPFLEDMGLNAGNMDLVPYGSFKPSEELISAYNRYVEAYKNEHGIETVEDLSKHIEECVNGKYPMLVPVDEVSQKRVDYMNKHIETLTETVVSKNSGSFGAGQKASD